MFLLVRRGFGGLDEAASSRNQRQREHRELRKPWTPGDRCHTLSLLNL
jgi:hypothetical protein